MTENRPTFTVLVPVYNHERYLGQALDSLLAQTDGNWEAIVVNDGSTDGTPAVMEAYATRDARFRLFHKPNGGVSTALNLGLGEARGEWICWLSSDDLFDPRKLELHREWIKRHPECRFFYSHFRELDDSAGQVRDVPPFAPPPERDWQVLAMLRCIFLYGNSVCMHRDACAATGEFDETLRYAQDYDYFLRMMVRFPAQHIPVPTCIIRRHPAQQTLTFTEACFFDSAKAGIRLLNTHSFASIVPNVNLRDSTQALSAVAKALEVAGNPNAFLHALGPHPALLLRVLEWAWGPEGSEKVRDLVRHAARETARRHRGTHFATWWKIASSAVRLPERRFQYAPFSPSAIGAAHYGMLSQHHPAQAEPVRLYLDRFERLSLPPSPQAAAGHCCEVVFVSQKGASVDDRVQYGSWRAMIEVSRRLMQSGHRVYVLGLSDFGMGIVEGVPFLGAARDEALKPALRGLDLVDTLVGISRADFLSAANVRRHVIYQHGPHPPIGASPQMINRSKAPVVVVSEDSRRAQVQWRIRADALHVIHNGYDSDSFRRGSGPRKARSLVFAAHVAEYKGADIALRAFELIRRACPEATLRVCGRTWSWRDARECLLPAEWLSRTGEPIWTRICESLPGVQYLGELKPDELARVFNESSLLIMPSRGETFGLVSLEAQACGCLPVLPRSSGFPETMQENITGYLYDENTPAALAARVAGLWAKDLPAEEQRQEAAQWVRENFSWEKTAAALLRVIEATPRRAFLRSLKESAWANLDRKAEPLRPAFQQFWYYVRRLRETPVKEWAGLARRWRARR